VTALRVLERAVDLAPGDHVSWAYDDLDGLREACADTFAEGAARGEQLVYIGDRGHEELRDDLSALESRDALLENGRLRLHSVAELYPATGRLEPQAQVETFRVEAERALRDGFTGLRVVGDVTEIVADPDQQADFLDYELALEDLYAASPVVGICAIDRSRVEEGWRELSALHRVQHASGHQPTFALTCSSGVVRLFGELDASSSAEFARLLDAVLASTSGALEVNLDALDFIDVGASRVLAGAHEEMSGAERELLLTGVRRPAALPLAAFNLHAGPAR
jgi:anti-anti-sigma factor